MVISENCVTLHAQKTVQKNHDYWSHSINLVKVELNSHHPETTVNRGNQSEDTKRPGRMTGKLIQLSNVRSILESFYIM